MPQRRGLLIGMGAAAALGAMRSRAFAADHLALFASSLTGDQPPANTGSKATGKANLSLNLSAQTVNLELAIVGIAIDQLWTKLVQRPIGPIHIHHYGSMHHSADDPTASLVLPVPFGPTYVATADGMKVTLRNYPYAAGAALLNSRLSFADFADQMRMGMLALNVHTNAFQDGEINGALVAV